MSHRTAATALLLASLPYGLSLPQILPLVNELAPDATPGPLPLVPAVNGSTVTVVGTIVQPAVESAVGDFTDVIEDAVETAAAAVESAIDAVSDTLPTDVIPILEAEASILPLILPGVLPVETDLPSFETPGIVPPGFPILDPGIGDGSFPGDDLPDTNDLEVIDLPVPDTTLPGDDLPDTNDLEVIDLPPPNTTLPGDDLSDTNDLEVIDLPVPNEEPYGDDDLIAEILPYFPDFPEFSEEATVPISTFNAVVQPLLSVIQALLDSLPGNFAPPLPDILIDPLLPTEPDIFIDPILPTDAPDVLTDPLFPTETINDVSAPATDAIDALIDPLVDPIPTLPASVATDIPFVRKRQAPSSDMSTNSIVELIGTILEAVNALLAQLRAISPVVTDAVPDIQDTLPDLPIDIPAVSIPDVSVPVLPVPNLPTDVLPTDSLPVAVPDIAIPDLPTPDIPEVLPPLLDLTSGIPDEVLNVPVPDDVEGIDWAAFESPPFSDLPAPSLDDLPIPDDVLNIPVPEFDENGVPIDTPLEAVVNVVTAIPAPLPTSLDALGDLPISDDLVDVPALDLPIPSGELPGLLDWPFDNWVIPETLTVDVDGQLPDLSDLPTADSVLNVPVPDFVADPTVPTEVAVLPVPTDLLDVPVPEGFEFWDELPVSTDPAAAILPAAPTLGDLADIPIPDDVLNIPVPEFDENGFPIDLPVEPVATIPTVPAALPTDLNFFDIPVPDGFEDFDVLLDVPAPAVSTGLIPSVASEFSIPDSILNIPVPEFDENGFPIDLPVGPTDALPAVPAALPTDLNFFDIPVPEGFEDFDAPIDVPAPAVPTGVVPDVTSELPIPDDVLGIPVPDFDETGQPIDLPAPALPVDAFGAGFPLEVQSDVPLVLPTGSLLPVEALLPIEGPAALPTDALSAVATDALSGLPTAAVPDVLPPTLPTEASVLPPEVSSVPALPVPAPALPTVPAVPVTPVIPVVPAVVPPAPLTLPRLPFQVPPVAKRQLLANTNVPATTGPSLINPVNGVVIALVKPLLSLVSALLAKLPVVGPTVPDLGAAVPDLSTLVPAIPDVPGLPDVGGIIAGVGGAAPVLPDVGGVASTVTGTVSGLAGGVVPRKNGRRQLSILSGGIARAPIIGGVIPTAPAGAPKVPLAFDSGLTKTLIPADLPLDPAVILQAVKPLLSIVETLVDSLPLSDGSLSLGKRDVAALPIDPDIIFQIISPLLQLVNTLVDAIPAPVPDLPIANIIGGLQKRGVATTIPALPVPLDTGAILAIIQPLLKLATSLLTALPVPAPAGNIVATLPVDALLANLPLGKRDAAAVHGLDLLAVIKPLLDLVTSLLESLPTPIDVPDVNVDNILGGLTKRQLDSVAGALPLDPSTVLNIVEPLIETVLELLKVLPSNPTALPKLSLSILGKRQLDSLPLQPTQVVSLVRPILALITNLLQNVIPDPTADALTPLTGVVGGLTKTLPIDVPIVRRTVEEFQQGPASDWMSFLGELDESVRLDLTGLIRDSANALNNDRLDDLSETLKSDIENLSETTKSRLLNGFAPGLATTFGKRVMRNGKRQAIPGAQSIGPNLDDALKVDLTDILGVAGTLDPFGQSSQSQNIPSHFEDIFPESYDDASQDEGFFEHLADSSVETGLNPELSDIIAAGGLDPNNMRSPSGGSPVDDQVEKDPYAHIRPSWESAQALEGLDATIAASKINHIGSKGPKLPFVPVPQGGSAAVRQATGEVAQQGNVFDWFHKFVRPSWNKNVDAVIVR